MRATDSSEVTINLRMSLQTDFMRANELPYAPLAPGAMDAELRAALAAVQRFKGEMEAANAVEQGGKDHQFYEVPALR